MAQPFLCGCGTPSCRGQISGADEMPLEGLAGMWLSAHVRDLLDEKHGEGWNLTVSWKNI